MNGQAQPGSRREVRLALVMNGGVSLAVWMSGVTREIDALQHAHEDIPDGATPVQERYLKVWQDVLKAAHRTRVSVDVVAGTSAGGLNGALLASAISRGERLDSGLRDLWVTAGSLKVGRLIQSATSDECSILGGDYFEGEIATALGLVEDAAGSLVMKAAGAGTQSCTLLTTATALRKQSSDDLGPDSRRVYRFTHRVDPLGTPPTPGWQRSDFARFPAALARAARASASFPAAFNPVFESPDLVRRRHVLVDEPATYLVDGGVLDNAPFSPLLDELRKRPIDGPFERFLLYIKPSAGGDGPSEPLSCNPPPLKVLGRVFTASREPDDRQDVEELTDLQGEMLHTETMPHLLLSRSFEPHSSMTGDALAAAATALLPHYQRGRRHAFELPLTQTPSVRFDVPPVTPLPAEGDRFGVMSLAMARDTWTWGMSTADRILRWWGRILNAATADDAAGTLGAAFASVSEGQRFVTVLYETDTGAWPSTETIDTLAELMWSAADAVASWLNEVQEPRRAAVTGDTLMASSLAVEVLTASFSWGHQDASDVPRFSYRQLTPAVPPVVNLEGVGESPFWERAHLYGSRWGHFGAFGADEWRASDWLWGRLDGGRQLIEMLVDDTEESAELVERLGEAILAEEGVGLSKVRKSANSVRNATPTSLWKDFVTDLDPATRSAIFVKLEKLPSQNLPPEAAAMVLAAVGRERPESTKEKWLDRRKENAKLRVIRAAFAAPRVYLRRKVKKALSSS